MKEQIQVPKELLESLLNSVNGDFYMGKEWEESTVAELRKHIAALDSSEAKLASQEDKLSAVPAQEPSLEDRLKYSRETGNAFIQQPAQEPAMDITFSQFLSDVLTAAGLVSHGKQCKALGERLGKYVMKYREPVSSNELVKQESKLIEIGEVRHFAQPYPYLEPAHVEVFFNGKPPSHGTKVYVIQGE